MLLVKSQYVCCSFGYFCWSSLVSSATHVCCLNQLPIFAGETEWFHPAFPPATNSTRWKPNDQHREVKALQTTPVTTMKAKWGKVPHHATSAMTEHFLRASSGVASSSWEPRYFHILHPLCLSAVSELMSQLGESKGRTWTKNILSKMV